MFFETEHININLLSTHELKWNARSENSDTRAFHALSFRISGSAKLTSGEKYTQASTGDILFVPAYCNYRLDCEEEHLIVIHFETDMPLPAYIKKFTPENPAYFRRKFEEIHLIWSKKQVGYDHECKSAFYKILLQIEKEYANTKTTGNEEKLNEVVDFIHDNFTSKEFTIDNLAQFCNMSGTYFRRLFLKKYGVSPLAYINNLRFHLALELLKSGYYTISEISSKCGFRNVYYFSNFIKKETGFSPTKLLKKNDKNHEI